jgi:PIN domain nuclease of toxin-antitoxin system
MGIGPPSLQLAVGRLPPHHRNPFDRMLVALQRYVKAAI